MHSVEYTDSSGEHMYRLITSLRADSNVFSEFQIYELAVQGDTVKVVN
jgi:hypothetical protein